ncbi:Ldh family oxidoreductase [Cupriavidus pampae]|uniref:(2R)-3-sulfolactate dehydrogenase (NADP(+)) n=1 Tax=Cupriavidus pampae TaxID=659251 RepID=A0ABN7Y2W5_9BURK|nr:Ldh family oxidoreductase [Cupriavidus pampae]CAG9167693.1 (2R)-3-sulfolactate dehydrogenase (NADP(+)) [Cupriavidus pampae]
MTRVALDELERIAASALRRAGASARQAAATAAALARADAVGLPSHGVSRVPMYVAHLRHDRVVGHAEPVARSTRASAVVVDAGCGFAFAACDVAIAEAMRLARTTGVGVAAVTNSHHFGAAALPLEAVASAGMIGIAMGNSPAAMPAWGGKRPLFGTNPIAAVFPRRDAAPVVIDLSLSEVARGKIMVAAKQGKAIPLGWALDEAGQPTTDASAALRGSMLPAGGVKGAMLALMVELLVTSLAGAQFGAEADSFFDDAGNRPRIGQLFLVLDPGAFAGSDIYAERVEALVHTLLDDAGARLPGARRQRAQADAAAQGVEIPEALWSDLKSLAGESIEA